MENEEGHLGDTAPVATLPQTQERATSVIFMVPDGFGDVAAEAYEFYKGSQRAYSITASWMISGLVRK